MPSQSSPRNIPWEYQIIPINGQGEATSRLAEETKLLKGRDQANTGPVQAVLIKQQEAS